MKPLKSTHQLTFVAISLSLHAFFVMLSITFTGFFFIIQLYLPLFTLLATYMLKFRFQVVYIIAAFALSFLLFPDITQLIFYILPSVVLGFFLGYLLSINRNFLEIAFVSISIQAGIIWSTIIFSNLFFDTNILRIFYQLLGIVGHPLLYRLNPLVIFIFSILEVMMTLLLIFPFLRRFNIVVEYKVPLTPFLFQSHLVFITIGILSAFLFPQLSVIVFPPVVFLTVYLYMYLFTRPTKYSTYVLLGAIFIFPLFNGLVSGFLSSGMQILSSYFLVIPPILFDHKKSIRILN
jgi:hypothetical protein